ncbi:MAG: hypothetical protein HKN22_00125, partial [Bacteroidia bacterium]|nr:hypothetical protein [Bacteroidia bacterium]
MNTLKLGLAFTCLSVFVAILALNLRDNTNDSPLPSDTILRQKDVANEENARADKYAYFEKMHNAAPDVDWRAIDHQTRNKKYFEKLARQNLRSSSAVDSFANGYLIGSWKEKGSRNQSGRIVYADIDTVTNELYCA